MKLLRGRIVCRLACLFYLTVAPQPARDEWVVHNDFSETFTVYVSPESAPRSISVAKIPPGEQRPLRTGQDFHHVEIVSHGGDLYVLTARLRNRVGVTELKTILGESGKENGHIIYSYKNQDDFNVGDTSRVENLRSSFWKTTYATPDGGRATTYLKFQGDVGMYYDGRGQMSQINYARRADKWIVSGNWVFDRNQSGQFQFFVNADETRFTSTPDGADSTWSGDRLRVRK
jgi:hypothetical protein